MEQKYLYTRQSIRHILIIICQPCNDGLKEIREINAEYLAPLVRG